MRTLLFLCIIILSIEINNIKAQSFIQTSKKEEIFLQYKTVINSLEFKLFCKEELKELGLNIEDWSPEIKNNLWQQFQNDLLNSLTFNSDFNKTQLFEIAKKKLTFIQYQTYLNYSNYLKNLNTLKSVSMCENAGFENANFNGWYGTTGINSGTQGSGNDINFTVTDTNSFNLCNIVTSGYDSIIRFLKRVPNGGGNYSCLMNHLPPPNGSASRISKTFTVDPNFNSFIVKHALVLEYAITGHTQEEMPYFTIRLLDSLGNKVNAYTYEVRGDITEQDLVSYSDTISNLIYLVKDWSSYTIPLENYIGQRVTIEITVADCAQTGHSGWAYIDAACSTLQISSLGDNICSDSLILFAPNLNASYSWSGPNGFNANTNSIAAIDSGYYSVYILPGNDSTKAFTLTKHIGKHTGELYANFTVSGLCSNVPSLFSDASISADTVISWTWDINNDGTIESTLNQFQHTYTDTGLKTINLIVQSNNCVVDTTIQINVLQSPLSTIDSIYKTCSGDSVLISNSLFDYNYSWSIGTTTDTIYIKTAGNYFVDIFNQNGCVVRENFQVAYQTPPITHFGYSDSSLNYSFNNQTINGTSYFWDFGDNASGVLNYSSNENPTHHFSTIGTFNVCLYSQNDCLSDTLCQQITVNLTGNVNSLNPKFTIIQTEKELNIINSKNDLIKTIELYNITGSLIKNWGNSLSNNGIISLNISGLISGVYLLKIVDHNSRLIFNDKILIKP